MYYHNTLYYYYYYYRIATATIVYDTIYDRIYILYTINTICNFLRVSTIYKSWYIDIRVVHQFWLVRSFVPILSIYYILYNYILYISLYIYLSLSLFLSIYLNIDVYLCACLSVCTPFLIIFSDSVPTRYISHNISYTHTYCYITRSYADEPLYYYLELLYFRYGLQFRLKDRTSSYFVICIPKTEPEMYRNSKHSSKWKHQKKRQQTAQKKLKKLQKMNRNQKTKSKKLNKKKKKSHR